MCLKICNKDCAMSIKLIAICYPKQECKEKFLEIASSLVLKSKKDDGCISYTLNEDNNGRILFIEEWENQEKLDLHIDNQSIDIECLKSLGDRQSEVIFYKTIES